MDEASDYAFPHSAEDESRRLELLQQRLDPLTKRRIQRLGVGEGARCLEVGGGRGSITRWLSEVAGPAGRVVATEIDIIQAGTDLAEFYQLSQAALAGPEVQAGALGPEQAQALIDRPGDADFLACGFVRIGVWGRRPRAE